MVAEIEMRPERRDAWEPALPRIRGAACTWRGMHTMSATTIYYRELPVSAAQPHDASHVPVTRRRMPRWHAMDRTESGWPGTTVARTGQGLRLPGQEMLERHYTRIGKRVSRFWMVESCWRRQGWPAFSTAPTHRESSGQRMGIAPASHSQAPRGLEPDAATQSIAAVFVMGLRSISLRRRCLERACVLAAFGRAQRCQSGDRCYAGRAWWPSGRAMAAVSRNHTHT